jgi:hypothetical protein
MLSPELLAGGVSDTVSDTVSSPKSKSSTESPHVQSPHVQSPHVSSSYPAAVAEARPAGEWLGELASTPLLASTRAARAAAAASRAAAVASSRRFAAEAVRTCHIRKVAEAVRTSRLWACGRYREGRGKVQGRYREGRGCAYLAALRVAPLCPHAVGQLGASWGGGRSELGRSVTCQLHPFLSPRPSPCLPHFPRPPRAALHATHRLIAVRRVFPPE